MPKYSDEQLGQYVFARILRRFDTAAKIIAEFNLNKKAQGLSFTKLTDAELQQKSKELAEVVINNLRLLSPDRIALRISRELRDNSYYNGINLHDYEDYFMTFEKEVVENAINELYNVSKKKFNAAKKKF